MSLKSLDFTKFNKWNIWRIINSVVIFLSFFAPFVVMDWGGQRDLNHALIATGFKTIDFYQYITGFEVFAQERELFERIRLVFALGQYFFGLYAILAYCLANLFLAAFRPKLFNKPIWIVFVLFVIVLGLRSLWRISALDIGWEALSNGLFGYWLVLIGLVSSVILEIYYFFSRRI
jgi:hypothetical protein